MAPPTLLAIVMDNEKLKPMNSSTAAQYLVVSNVLQSPTLHSAVADSPDSGRSPRFSSNSGYLCSASNQAKMAVTSDNGLDSGAPSAKRLRTANGNSLHVQQQRSLRLNSNMGSHVLNGAGSPLSRPPYVRWPAVDGPETAVTSASMVNSVARRQNQTRTSPAGRGMLRAPRRGRGAQTTATSHFPARYARPDPGPRVPAPLTHDHTSLMKTLSQEYPTAGMVHHTPPDPSPQPVTPTPVTVSRSCSTQDALMIDVREGPARQSSAPSSLPVATPPPVKQMDAPKLSPTGKCETEPLPPSSPVLCPIESRQLRVESRIAGLADRIKDLEAAQTQYHLCGEIERVVTDYADPLDLVQPGSSSKKLIGKTKNHVLEEKLDLLLRNGSFQTSAFREEQLRGMSATELARMIKRCENKQLLDLVSPSAAHVVLQKKHRVNIKCADVDSIENASERLERRLRDQQHCHDPEATDSSSDSDSDDECEAETRARAKIRRKHGPDAFSYLNKRPTSIGQMARSKWYAERAWLGSRWAWLQSQVADLEYKIRQQVDICRQIRARKEPFVHDPQPSTSASTSAKPDECASCARVRPVTFKERRKLIRTAGIYRWNRKTTRLATLHCGCYPPLQPCILCSGRINNVDSCPDPCTQSLRERAALLDPSFHPALSDRRGIGLDRRLQSLVKLQASAPRTATKRSPAAKKGRAGEPQKKIPRNVVDGVRKVLDKNKALKLKLKLREKDKKYYKSKKDAAAKLNAKRKKLEKFNRRRLNGSRTTSPLLEDLDLYGRASPAKLTAKLAGAPRRSTSTYSAYEIDNIVIDPSVLAVSKVEKLQYKEIATPGWRENAFVALTDASDVTQVEDLREEEFLRRHAVKEGEERRRFKTYKQNVWTQGKCVEAEMQGPPPEPPAEPVETELEPPIPVVPFQRRDFPIGIAEAASLVPEMG